MSESVAGNPSEAFQESKAQRRWRFRWVRRFLYSVVAMIVGVFVLRLVWGFLAQRELDNLIESYRAEGGPVTVDEFNAELDRVPEKENAAVLYEKAATTYVAVSQSGESLQSFLDDRQKLVDQSDVAAELMEANAETLALLREARSRPQVAWSARLGNPESGLSYTELRNLARLLVFAADQQMHVGKAGDAVESLHDLIGLGDALRSQPLLLESLMSWATDGLAYDAIERHGPAICGQDSGETVVSVDSTTKKLVRGLMISLVDDERFAKHFHRSMAGERAAVLHDANATALSDWYNPVSGSSIGVPYLAEGVDFLLQPIVTFDSLRQAQFDTQTMDLFVSASSTYSIRRTESSERSQSLVSTLTQPITNNWFWTSAYAAREPFVRQHFESCAKRRMAATVLAIHLYAQEHARRPESLNELVPEYMSELPREPFAEPAKPLGYKPEAQPAYLYSIGRDGVDVGGEQVYDADGDWDRFKSDIVFYLDPE